MDLASITAAASSLKIAGDIAKGLLDLKVSADVQRKVIDLQCEILAAQSSALAAHSEQFSMLEEIRSLKEEVARVKAWKETKQRYQLHEPMRGTFVYALKEEGESAEPAHWICATCYENSKRSILQLKSTSHHNNRYFCPSCGTEIRSQGTRGPLPSVQSRRPRY